MPVHTGYDSNKEEPKCYAQWGSRGKKYYYTCGDKEAREKAKAKANAQGQAIIASGWTESQKNMKGDEKILKTAKNKNAGESLEEKLNKIRKAFEEDLDKWIVYTFDSSVIIKDETTGKYYEVEYSILESGEIVKGEPKEVELTYIQKRLFAESFDFTSVKNLDTVNKDIQYIVDSWDDWAGSFDTCVSVLGNKPGITDPEALCAWLHYQAEGKWPGEKSREENKGCELTGPIFKRDNKQRIVYAAVLVPGEPDYDYSKGEKILTKEEIEFVAHKWMEDYGNIDYMHGMNNVAKPVETYILPMDLKVELEGEQTILPEGTWVLAAKVTNDEVWKKVEKKELTGFSIMGIPNSVLKGILAKVTEGETVDKEFSEALKKVLIRDLGKDWVVPFVSLVDQPCVPKAKFFAIKQKPEEKTNWGKFVNFFKKNDAIAEKSGRTISDATYEDLKKAVEALQKLMEKADKERRPKYMKGEEHKEKKEPKGDEDMNEEEVLKKIDEKLEKRLKPLEEGLKSLLSNVNNSTDSDATNKDNTDNKDNKDDMTKKDDNNGDTKNQDNDALKKENLTLQETLDILRAEKAKLEEELKKGVSKTTKGQEDDSDTVYEFSYRQHMEELGRDSQGRAKLRKEMK